MSQKKHPSHHFAICIDNSGYPASLELHKVYCVLPDDRAGRDDYIRVIDESGEDYLYPAVSFVAVEQPPPAERSLLGKAS